MSLQHKPPNGAACATLCKRHLNGALSGDDLQQLNVTCSARLEGRNASNQMNDTCTWPASLEIGNRVSMELNAR